MFFARHKTIILTLALVLAACREPDESVVIAEHVLVAEAGYTVPRLNGFDVEVSGTSLQLTESGYLRAPLYLRVRPTTPNARLDGEVQKKANTVYTIEETGAGSGGVLWQLTALRQVGDTTVEIAAFVQTEAAYVPAFAWAWPVIEGIAPKE